MPLAALIREGGSCGCDCTAIRYRLFEPYLRIAAQKTLRILDRDANTPAYCDLQCFVYDSPHVQGLPHAHFRRRLVDVA